MNENERTKAYNNDKTRAYNDRTKGYNDRTRSYNELE